MSRVRFRTVFVVIPALSCSILPTAIFGTLLGQWGSNVVWGSYFELGWCLAAFWSGGIVHDRFSSVIGLCWGWLALLSLYLFADWLWRHMTERGRRSAIWALGCSTLAMLPADVMMRLDQTGVHLPDYTTHLATSY